MDITWQIGITLPSTCLLFYVAAATTLYRILMRLIQTSDWHCRHVGERLRNSWRGGRNVASMVHGTDRANGRCDVWDRSRIRGTFGTIS